MNGVVHREVVNTQEVHDIFVATQGVDAQLWGTDFAVCSTALPVAVRVSVPSLISVSTVMVVEKLPSVRVK